MTAIETKPVTDVKQTPNTMRSFQYKQSTWLWNPFWGVFVLPISPSRKKEKVVKEGSTLYAELYQAASQP